MTSSRSSGILLHPTSLPGKYGIGSLGRQAIEFIDFLEKAGQKLWQVLPMGHTGYGDSPYQCFSIFAGNPILVDPDLLVKDGLLSTQDLQGYDNFPTDHVDYGWVIDFKKQILWKAYMHFIDKPQETQEAFIKFVEANKHWLDDYATFIAIKDHFGGQPWWEWTEDFRFRDPDTINEFIKNADKGIGFYKFSQYLFFKQWKKVRNYANERGISIVGDIPLYVAHDSADVWNNHRVFQFDENRMPLKVAGVPPDYFSETGQLWGNPLYDWDYMQKEGFKWWIGRVKASLELYDYVRIDHFRGFEAYWAVPYGEETAINGEWIKAPGKALFDAIREDLGMLPIIAEDLGIITPEVEALRDHFGFPGMKILQFAFHSDEGSGYLPHNYSPNFIVYTGTHDNDTLLGWFRSLEDHVKDRVLEYADASEDDIVKKMIRLAWSSVAEMAIIPLQDLLDLGSEGRMNIPGTPGGNWQWRFTTDQLADEKAEWLRIITKIYNR
nr:4-alpha-glucanotransferase [Bacteroidota bacterium]